MFICIYLPFPPRKSSLVGGAFFCAVAAAASRLAPSLSHSVCDAAAALCCINLFHVRHPGQDSRRRLRGLHITGSRSVGEEHWLGISTGIRRITTLKCTGTDGYRAREERGRVFARRRRRINLVDEMAVNERRERESESGRNGAGDEGPRRSGRGRLIRPCEDWGYPITFSGWFYCTAVFLAGWF